MIGPRDSNACNGSSRGSPRGSGHAFAFGLGVVLLALGVFAAVALYTRMLERRALEAAVVYEQLTPAGHLRPRAEIAEAVRQMQLVTVEIRTRVESTISHESWRGDVAAHIEAPVRLLYGADLSQLETESIAYSPAMQAYAIRIPAPRRIATEVCATDEEVDVQVGWLRLRSRAGEYYLGLARRSLHERAQELVLSPEDAAMVREATSRQIEALVRRIVGRDVTILVNFDQRESP